MTVCVQSVQWGESVHGAEGHVQCAEGQPAERGAPGKARPVRCTCALRPAAPGCVGGSDGGRRGEEGGQGPPSSPLLGGGGGGGHLADGRARTAQRAPPAVTQVAAADATSNGAARRAAVRLRPRRRCSDRPAGAPDAQLHAHRRSGLRHARRSNGCDVVGRAERARSARGRQEREVRRGHESGRAMRDLDGATPARRRREIVACACAVGHIPRAAAVSDLGAPHRAVGEGV